ncbi:MAG: DNA-formamidopyrimidine glycosylase family protein [Acidimicrobiales bacterium]
MPELPEMQALAERLDAAFASATVERIDVLGFSALKTVAPGPPELIGAILSRVGRRGKYLVFDLTIGPPEQAPGPAGTTPAGGAAASSRVFTHLFQGGRVTVEDPPRTSRPKGSVVRWVFGDGPSLLVHEYGSERKAAWWIVAGDDPGPTAGLGPEPDDPRFHRLVMEGQDRRRLFTFLRDQRTVAGLGRGHTDDILHRARLSPYACLANLDPAARHRLGEAIAEVLASALLRERRRTGGLPARLDNRFTIHGRAGTPCPICGGDLRRVSYESYELTYCPVCQTGGKPLSDRRMSRLLR